MGVIIMSRSVHFTPGTHIRWASEPARMLLDGRKISCICKTLKHDSSIVQPAAKPLYQLHHSTCILLEDSCWKQYRVLISWKDTDITFTVLIMSPLYNCGNVYHQSCLVKMVWIVDIKLSLCIQVRSDINDWVDFNDSNILFVCHCTKFFSACKGYNLRIPGLWFFIQKYHMPPLH
jgi:hypothetical protein